MGALASSPRVSVRKWYQISPAPFKLNNDPCVTLGSTAGVGGAFLGPFLGQSAGGSTSVTGTRISKVEPSLTTLDFKRT